MKAYSFRKSTKMKKYTILVIATVIALVMALTSCSNNNEPSKVTENNSVSITDTANTEPIETDASSAIGGANSVAYEAEYIIGFYGIGGRFEDLVEDKDAIEKWVKSGSSEDGNTYDRNILNVLNFIQTFDIPKEDFKAANLIIGEEYAVFTDAQIEALYSGDKKLFADEFANPLAINIDGDIYTPEWIVTHNLDEIKAAGITEEMLSDKYDEWVEYWSEDSEPCTKAKALLDEYQLSETE